MYSLIGRGSNSTAVIGHTGYPEFGMPNSPLPPFSFSQTLELCIGTGNQYLYMLGIDGRQYNIFSIYWKSAASGGVFVCSFGHILCETRGVNCTLRQKKCLRLIMELPENTYLGTEKPISIFGLKTNTGIYVGTENQHLCWD